jgi:hypothetical protein
MTARTDVIDRIVTVINTVTTAGGYYYNITSAAHDSRIFFEEPASKFPLIDIIGGTEQIEYHPADYVEPRMTVIVRGAVRGKDLPGMEKLLADVKNVLAKDSTLNEKCISCVPVSVVTDEGFMAHSAFEMRLTVTLEHQMGGA